MKAVVMAGGEGSRLRPLTSTRPKPLAPVANKPVMEHIIDLLRTHEIREVVGTLHYLADEIESYFGDGSAFGVALSYVVEDTPLGTAGAVKLAEHLLRDEPFLVISGDALTDADLTALLADHARSGATATIALQRVANPLEFGVVITDDHKRITRFLEKPSWGEIFSDTINTGIYVLDPVVFDFMERGKNYDFSRDIFPRLLHEGKLVQGFITENYWTDIGNLQQYRQANYDALNGKVRVKIPGTESSPGIWLGEDCRIDPDAHLIAPVVLGKNVVVEAGAVVGADTVLGNSTIVARNARVHRTIAWDDAYFGESSALNGCTVADRNIVKDRVSIGEGTVIGRGCTIGSGAVLRPNIKIWPDKTVSSGSIVSMSLDLRNKVARFALRRLRSFGIGERRDHAGIRDEARSSVRLASAARPDGHDQPRLASRLTDHEPLHHIRSSFGRSQRRGPAFASASARALRDADGRRRWRPYPNQPERPKLTPDGILRRKRDQRRQIDRAQSRKPLLP